MSWDAVSLLQLMINEGKKMTRKHKWHKEIKAWADGAEIEGRFYGYDGWSNWNALQGGFTWFIDNAEYRIKPQPKEPQYMYIYWHENEGEYKLFDTRLANSFKYHEQKYKYIGKIKLKDE